MKRVNREPTKFQSLYDLFPEVGDKHLIETVKEVTGITSERVIAVYLSQYRKDLPPEQRIHVVKREGILERRG